MIFLAAIIGFFILGTITECIVEEYKYQKLKNERKRGKWY